MNKRNEILKPRFMFRPSTAALQLFVWTSWTWPAWAARDCWRVRRVSFSAAVPRRRRADLVVVVVVVVVVVDFDDDDPSIGRNPPPQAEEENLVETMPVP